jgi:hypothetical protein
MYVIGYYNILRWLRRNVTAQTFCFAYCENRRSLSSSVKITFAITDNNKLNEIHPLKLRGKAKRQDFFQSILGAGLPDPLKLRGKAKRQEREHTALLSPYFCCNVEALSI